jgi:two-component system phosphate regulon sensor histidine kinase PhoR
MEAKKPLYRKNLSLVISFFILITISFVLAIVLAYNLTSKYVENEFSSNKIKVFEEVIKPYNDFFQNSVPEISYYQGYLDSASAAKYAKIVSDRYPFIEKVIFYDTEISNHPITDGFVVRNFSISPKAVYQFAAKNPKDSIVLFKNNQPNTLSLKTADEFNKMAIKFSSFIESLDTTKALSEDQIFSVFYSINPNRITYLNIPRREELGIFQDLMLKKAARSPVFEKDMFSFYLNPAKLALRNPHPELYQQIKIVPLVYELLTEEAEQFQTELALPGAFAGYKLYLSSSPKYLRQEINTRFLPIAGLLFLIYGILAALAYLIYRNLYINQQLFKLQYDFINNFSHEFKTPVSVIKVAGNNISNAAALSDKERQHYGRILDQEADKLNELMNKLLSFTQIENKSIEVKEVSINLKEFTENLIKAYHLNKPDFNINLNLSEPIPFKTDPVLLNIIFNNLMDNAYKYSEPERKLLDINIRKNGLKLILQFKDQGIGIEKADQQHIFKKFYRIESRYNQQGSVGLGLALCKELIKFMNGSIEVQSQPGKGTVFTIELPYQV